MAGMSPERRCVLSENVLLSCMTHALTTDQEEIIGFCLGASIDGNTYIWETCVAPRRDKKSDRVEVEPQASISASESAAELSATLGVPTTVVGWYHSHPRGITCPPSHVDCGTQNIHEVAHGNGFVGLIFSTFNPTEPASLPHIGNGRVFHNTVQCHCFQSPSPSRHVSLAVDVQPLATVLETAAVFSGKTPRPTVPRLFEGVARLVDVMHDEEVIAYQKHKDSVAAPHAALHASAVFSKATSKISQCCAEPLLSQLESDMMSLDAIGHDRVQRERAEEPCERDLAVLEKLERFSESLRRPPP